MTATLALVKVGYGTATGTTTISLLSFTDGFDLLDNGWAQSIGNAGDVSVFETLTLLVRGTSHDDLAAKVRALDQHLQNVLDARDPTQLDALWLRAKMNSETGARQALILSTRRSPIPLWRAEVNNSVGGYFYQEAYALAIERRAVWEADTVIPDGGVANQMAGLSTIGGVGTLYAVGGDVPARADSIPVYGDANAANTTAASLNKIWLGFRTSRFGTVANFQSYWSLRKGTAFGSNTTGGTTNADAEARDGYKVITAFANATLERRVTIKASAVTANPEDQRGTFLVLLRAKVAAGVYPITPQVRVRLADGLYGSPSFTTRARVPISGASGSWQLYELGTVQIPTPGRGYSTNFVSNYALAIDAEISPYSASISLEMDCLILIPINECLMTADLGALALAQSLDSVVVGEHPEGDVYGYANLSAVPNANGVFRLTGGVPVGAGIAVLAAQRSGLSLKSDTDTVIVNTRRRYETLRGAG